MTLKRVDKAQWDQANRMIGQLPHRNQVEANPTDPMNSCYLTFVGDREDEQLGCLIIPGPLYPEESLLLADIEAIERAYNQANQR
jgi:hypothetical protein